jgi:hypothetical protein
MITSLSDHHQNESKTKNKRSFSISLAKRKRCNGEKMDGKMMGVLLKMRKASCNFALLIELFSNAVEF